MVGVSQADSDGTEHGAVGDDAAAGLLPGVSPRVFRRLHRSAQRPVFGKSFFFCQPSRLAKSAAFATRARRSGHARPSIYMLHLSLSNVRFWLIVVSTCVT
jgi:hypothetical protein